MRRVLAAVLATALAVTLFTACGDADERVDFGGEDIGPDIHSMLSQDGAVKMGLTRDWVYFALSDSARAAAQSEMAEDTGDVGFFGGIMRRLVGKALNFRARYAVAEIRDIRWAEGRMRIEFYDPDRRIDDNLQLGEDQSVTEGFAEEDIRAFGAAFRSVKESGSDPGR